MMTIVYLGVAKMKLTKVKPVIALILIIVAGFFIWTKTTKNTQEQITATGTIEATTVQVSAKLPGSLEKILVKAGDKVQKDQLIAQVERNDLLAQRERDQLSVVKAEAYLHDLASGAREEEIQEAEAKVNIAEATYNMKEEDYKRTETLVAVDAIPQVELEKAELNLEISRNELKAARAKLNLLLSGIRKEQINMAQVDVERLKAVLQSTEVLLEDLNIYAPLEGVVLTRNYEEGEYVQAGGSLVTIANLDDLWIKVFVPTDDLPQVFLGQSVQFTVSGTDQVFKGVVDEIADKGEFTPKTIQTKKERTNIVFAVKISIPDNHEGLLKPGLPADVVFLRGTDND